MKTINPVLRIAILALLCCAVYACSKDNGGNNSTGEESPYWKDSYKQHQLYGKVKTVKETNPKYSDSYDWMEFDNQGNLLKNLSYWTDGDYSGLTFTYDGQNRLTKVVYGSKSNPTREVAEFSYNGKHNKYIPTNIYSMADLRMYRGVSSVSYKMGSRDPMVLNYKSGTDNQIVFDGTIGGIDILEDAFGSTNITVIADCNTNYPTKIQFKGMGTGAKSVIANITFYDDGMPKEIVSSNADGMVVTNKYTSIAGFMLMTAEIAVNSDGETSSVEYKYNDKGQCIYCKEASDMVYRYSYEYDSQGNWTKQVCEVSYNNEATWAPYETLVREYTYW